VPERPALDPSSAATLYCHLSFLSPFPCNFQRFVLPSTRSFHVLGIYFTAGDCPRAFWSPCQFERVLNKSHNFGYFPYDQTLEILAGFRGKPLIQSSSHFCGILFIPCLAPQAVCYLPGLRPLFEPLNVPGALFPSSWWNPGADFAWVKRRYRQSSLYYRGL
jgi:hypothetical protein